MNKVLITFGCSWTKGVGAGYGVEYESNSKDDYRKKCFDTSLNEHHSFKSLLCKKYNLKNINFSVGASSNQTQFRLAEEFFTSDEFDLLQMKYTDGIYVMWGITSTLRGEFYINRLKQLKNIFYSGNAGFKNFDTVEKKLSSLIGINFYNHDVEVRILNKKINHWNKYFNFLGIKNIWFDTFNHHKYQNLIYNLAFKYDVPRDLLSKIVNDKIYYNKIYHTSSWEIDGIPIQQGIDLGLLNPYSMHPTSKGHKMIADILSPEIEKMIE
jgi:hypothetical protein